MKYLIILVLSVGSVNALLAQRIDTLVHIYSNAYPKEKLYLHLDRTFYNSGDSIWYKAYLSEEGFPSQLSKNIYVELIDDKGQVLDRNVAPVIESSVAGNFLIAHSYKGAYVYLRAYTRWMLNFDSTFLFFKPVRILNNPLPSVKSEGSGKEILRFFPEGGDWVAGLESRMAFKANDITGYPDSVQGTIVTAKGVKVASFASVRDGMGAFTLTPQKGEIYAAKWKDKNNVVRTTPLPLVKPNGVVLKVVGLDSTKVYTVTSSNDDSIPAVYHLVGHTNGEVFYMATLRLQNGESISQSFSTTFLPSGIVTITIFDKDWEPVAERITFVDNNEYMFYPGVHPLYTKLDKRGENTLEIEYSDTVKSNLSASVTNADLETPPDSKTDNIISNLLLTSELRGRIYNPWDYLSNPIDSVRKELDLVLLTNGWRRYNWDDIVHKQYPPLKFLPDSFMSLNGRVYGIADKRGIGSINMITDGGGSRHQLLFAEVDTTGQFQVANHYVYGQQKVYFQFNKKDQYPGATLVVDNGLWKGTRKLNMTDSMMSDVQAPSPLLVSNNRAYLQYVDSAIKNKPKIKTLQTIVIKAPEKSPVQKLDEKYATGLFQGGDGYDFDVANDPMAAGIMSVFQYLQGKVPGLQITVNGTNTSLSWRGGTPGLYLDEMNVDVSALQNMNMSDVALIKVMRPPFMGMDGGNGGIAVYSKKGGDVTSTNSNFKAMESTVLNGYTPVKEFYSPDYATPISYDSLDLRTTLLWQPFVLLDKTTRRIKLTFYNSDVAKRFKVVVEGMTADGRWAYKELLIDRSDTIGQ